MICPICRDTSVLSQQSTRATNAKADLQTALDLQDTLRAHANHCVGMAANMIGVCKCIIAVKYGGTELLMCNPVIAAKSEPYEAEEGCLSLSGTRTVQRFRRITVQWQDTAMHKHRQQFEGYPAQIIQHEIDHTNGILI